MRLLDLMKTSVVGSLPVFLIVGVAVANDASVQVGVAPTRDDPKQFSLDEDNIGRSASVTPVDADDLSSIWGIDGMGYVYQTFVPGTAAPLVPSPPVGYHNAVLNPFDLGLRRNVLQPGAPRQTHKDEVNALSYGNDFMYLDGKLTGFEGLGEDPPLFGFAERGGFASAGPPVVEGHTRVGVEFSVDVHARGIAGTGVASVGPPPLEPSSHVFVSQFAGTNSVLYSDVQLGVFRNDDVDAYENVPDRLPALQGPDALGMPAGTQRHRVFFSVDNETQGHNSASTLLPNAVSVQAGLGEASGDIFVGIGGGNLLLIDEVQLGLWPGMAAPAAFDDADDLDALALNILIPDLEARIEAAWGLFVSNPSSEFGITKPLLNRDDAAVLFSVEEGSIGMFGSAVDFEHRIDLSEESGDLFFSNLSGQNWLAYEATSLGLLEHDELDALDTAAVPEPSTLAMLAAAGLLGMLGLVRKRRRAIR